MDITGAGEVAQAAASIAGRFFPDKTEVEKAKIAQEMQDTMNAFKLQSAQTDINALEAKSENWFVAGWRPFVGWTCGMGLLYQFLFMPIMNGIIKAILIAIGHTGATVLFVSLDTGTLLNCLGGLLGLGGLRTVEKIYDVHGNH